MSFLYFIESYSLKGGVGSPSCTNCICRSHAQSNQGYHHHHHHYQYNRHYHQYNHHHHQLIAPFSDLVQWVADHMGIGEFLPSNWLMDLIADFACGEIMMMIMMKMRMLVIYDMYNIHCIYMLYLSCSGPNNPLEIICENVVFLLTGYDE